MGRGLWAIALLFLATLAGCADDGASPQVDVPESIEEVEVTEDTGALRGIVLDEKITPISGAVVAVTGVDGTQTTAADGGFVFSGLEPGDYFITASKPGYKPVPSSGAVVAGDADPPLVKMVLALDNATAPFVELQNWKAFLQCGAGAPGGGSWNPCLFTGSDNVHFFRFGLGITPTFGQAEAVWSGTQPLGNQLYFEMAGKGVVGDSPLVIRATEEDLDEGSADDQVMVRVFAGDESPTVVLNQAYDVFVLYFYNMVPREDYVFAIDGPCDPPTSCQ